MEIDPAALSRPNPYPDSSATPSITTKVLPNVGRDAQKSRTAPAAPRVDLEPFYNELKSAIGDQWSEYKEAVSHFIIGYLSQTELSNRIEPFLKDPYLENVHNQLICGIYANTGRDAPDTVVATWVSANDKPANLIKPPTGDVADQKLKHEIMHLPPRLRNRMKAIRDEPRKPVAETLIGQSNALTIHQSHEPHTSTLLSSVDVSASATNTAGINRDVEIRRRFQQPLISEIRDLPTSSALNDRILPICYQEGLHAGLNNNELCAELISIAVDVFMKDLVTTIVSRTRCNAPVSGPKPDSNVPTHLENNTTSGAATLGTGLDRTGLGIMTASYKRKLKEEEKLWERGQLKRSDAGLLPVEVHALQEPGRGKGVAGDLRLALETEDTWFRALAPWQAERIVLEGDYLMEAMKIEEDPEGRRQFNPQIHSGGSAAAAATAATTNAAAAVGPSSTGSVRPLTNGTASGINGYHHLDMVPKQETEVDLGWAGAKDTDKKALGSLLESCLNFE